MLSSTSRTTRVSTPRPPTPTPRRCVDSPIWVIAWNVGNVQQLDAFQDGICHYSAANVAGNDTGYIDVNPTEKDLAHAVQTVGPISVAMDASLWSFNMYAGGKYRTETATTHSLSLSHPHLALALAGIYDDAECGNTEWDLDHGVLAVGFGSGWTTDDYWLVKNSWGADWGENGYFRMARNKNNRCGIATMASYPTV